MTARARALALRRERLIERGDRLRAELESEGRDLALRLRVADRVVGIVRSGPVRALAIAGAALAILWYPRRLVRIAGRALVLWPLVRPLLPGLVKLWRERSASAT